MKGLKYWANTNYFLNLILVLDYDIKIKNIASEVSFCSNTKQFKETIKYDDVKVEFEEDNIGKYKLQNIKQTQIIS